MVAEFVELLHNLSNTLLFRLGCDEGRILRVDHDHILKPDGYDQMISLTANDHIFTIDPLSTPLHGVPLRIRLDQTSHSLPTPHIVPGERSFDHGDVSESLHERSRSIYP